MKNLNEPLLKNKQIPPKTPIKYQEMKNIKNEIKSDNENEFDYDDNFFSPSKLSSDFFDTSMLDENEVVKMLHDSDKILDLDNIQHANDSINFSSLDENSNAKSPADPLSLENEYKTESNEIANKLRPRKIKNYSYDHESKNSSLTDNESEEDDKFSENRFQTLEKHAKQKILSSKTIKKLNELKIRLTHAVPPQHKIGSASRTFTRKNEEKFHKFFKRIKTKFTEQEDSIIKQNWKLFCEIHDWEDKNVHPFLCMQHQGKRYLSHPEERQKFAQFLAKGLPGRALVSVYQRFKFIFSKYNTKGRFTAQEDKKILSFMRSSKMKKEDRINGLSKILSRPYQSIYGRLKKLRNRKPRKKRELTKVVWTSKLTKCFLKNLMKITLSDDISQLKNQRIPLVIWKKLEKMMHIKVSALKRFWFTKLHLQLFSQDRIFLNDIKIKLIEFLSSSEISNAKEINWTELLNHFDGMTVEFVCEMTFRILTYVSKSKCFVDRVSDLDEKILPRLKQNCEDKILPRLRYENEKLTVLDKIQSDDDSLKENDTSLKKRVESLRSSKTKDKNRNFIWTLSLREKLIKMLLEIMIFNDIRELKNAVIPAIIWEKLSPKFHVDREELENFWYSELHMQLFSPDPIYLNDLKIKLIELIYEREIKSEEDVNWEEIRIAFDGLTTNFLSQLFHDLIDEAPKKIKSSKFPDVMEYLHETALRKLKIGRFDKFLPRIIFENDKIRMMDENRENEKSTGEKCESKIAKESEIHWTLGLRENFLKLLLRFNLNTSIEEQKDAEIPMIVWEEMEKQLKIDQSVLQDLWYKELHLQLFSSKPIYLNDIEMYLIELIYNMEITDEEEINWNELCSHFDGMTTNFLSELFIDLVNFASQEIESTKFWEIMEYLYETRFSKLKTEQVDRFLPRINFDNERIQVIDEKMEKSTCETDQQETANDSEMHRTLSVREKFLKLLLQLTVTTKIQDLKDAEIPKIIWKKMENQLKVDRKVLEDLWYQELHLQLFSSNHIYLNDIKMKLIELIYEQEVTDQKEIDWIEICTHFEGMTTNFLSQVLCELIDETSNVIDSKKFCDIIEYLHETKFNELKKVSIDRLLPRIIYESGRIHVL